MAAQLSLEALRDEIDKIDEVIVRLLDSRARCAYSIGRLKHELGRPVYEPVYEPNYEPGYDYPAARGVNPVTTVAGAAIGAVIGSQIGDRRSRGPSSRSRPP